MTSTSLAEPWSSPHGVADLLGDFWLRIYPGRDQVEAYARSKAFASQQAEQDLREWLDTFDHHRLPVHRRSAWHRLRFAVQERQAHLSIRYGDGHLYGGNDDEQNTLQYGASSARIVSYPWPSNVVTAAALTSAVMSPGLVLVRGVDFLVGEGRVYFRSDPALHPAVEKEPAAWEMWAYEARLDESYLQQHLGFMVGLPLASTISFGKLASTLMDAFTGATAYEQLVRLLSLVADAPFVQDEHEVVETIISDRQGVALITDRNVYRLPTADSAVVLPGDRVRRLDWLSDAVRIYEACRGEAPDAAELASITLGPELLDPSVGGPLTFSNADVPLQGEVVNGKLKVWWQLGGAANHVAAFFDAMHERGLALGRTMAQCLDLRSAPEDEPSLACLPPVVNPLRLVFQNVLRNHILVVRLRPERFGPRALGMEYLGLLRSIMPPHASVVIAVGA